MAYFKLMARRKNVRSEEVIEFCRNRSGFDSFLCNVPLSSQKLEALVESIENERIDRGNLELGILDKIALKLMWRAKLLFSMGGLTDLYLSNYIYFYAVTRKEGEIQIAVKTRNDRGNQQELSVMTRESVIEALKSVRGE